MGQSHTRQGKVVTKCYLDAFTVMLRHGGYFTGKHPLLHLLLVEAGPHQLAISQLPEQHAKRVHIACLANLTLQDQEVAFPQQFDDGESWLLTVAEHCMLSQHLRVERLIGISFYAVIETESLLFAILHCTFPSNPKIF